MKGDVFRRPTCFLTLLSTGGALPTFAQNPGRPIRAIGEFSNMRYTEEHAYGYTVALWRDGDTAVGQFLVSEGLQGDTPTGMLENVRFDSRTGALSFTAKLTTGATILPGGRQEPSRDLFKFSGTLKATTLTGSIMRSDQRSHRVWDRGNVSSSKCSPRPLRFRRAPMPNGSAKLRRF
jgi:hypothetical protein